MRSHRILTSALYALLASSLAFATATAVGAASILPPANPSSNVAPTPNFFSSGQCRVTDSVSPCQNPCVTMTGIRSSPRIQFPAYSTAPSCTNFLLRAVNDARSAEGLSPLVLPSNWYTLSQPEQLFVMADLERTSRGLPPYLGLNRALSNEAHQAALHQRDPAFAPHFRVGIDAEHVHGMGATLAIAYSVMEADYVWMYDDGWGGSASATPNYACTSATAPGCWGHRDQLLGYDGAYNFGVGLHCTKCEMGAGFAVVGGSGSYTDLIELPAGRAPRMYFTWAKDVLPYLATTTALPPSNNPLPTTTTSALP